MTTPDSHIRTAPQVDSIQALRAIAALLVLFSHAEPSLAEFGYLNTIPNFTMGAVGVDLFFVISGFIMVYTSEAIFGRSGGAAHFFTRRLIRIVPLYWFLTTLALIGRHGITLPTFDSPASVLGSYLFLPIARPSGGTMPVLVVGWTLEYEMLFYVILAAVIALPRNAAVIAATIVLFILTATQSALGDSCPLIIRVWGCPIIAEFAMGMGIAIAFRRGWRISSTASLLIIVVAVLAIAVFHEFNLVDETPTEPAWSRLFYWGIAAAAIVGAIVLTRSKHPIPHAAIAMGDASYALYLCHSFVPFAIAAIGLHSMLNPGQYPYTYSALFILLSITAAFMLNFGDAIVRGFLLARTKNTMSVRSA